MVYYGEIITLAKMAKKKFENESWTPVAVDVIYLCIRVASRKHYGHSFLTKQRIHLDSVHFDETKAEEIVVKTQTDEKIILL